MGYYKLYIKKHNGSYNDAEIFNTHQELINRISNLKEEYLIIHYHNDMDEIYTYEPCKVKFVDKLETDFEVKTHIFNPIELTKKQKRARDKQDLHNEIKDYINR